MHKKNKKPLISYQCDNCKSIKKTERRIPRCLGCGKALCESCNTFLLCPQDFQMLKKKDQRRMKRRAKSIEKAGSFEKGTRIAAPIVGIIAIALLIAMIAIDNWMFYAIFGTFGSMLLFFALALGIVFRNFKERERQRIHRQAHKILIKYNIKRVNLVNSAPKEKEVEVKEKINTITCTYCGYITEGVDIICCEMCGADLKN